MSILINQPLLSLYPTATPQLIKTIVDPVALTPLALRAIIEPNVILYDPYMTVDAFFNVGYYVSYLDLNYDIDLQKKVMVDIYNKLTKEWIYTYNKIFKYVEQSDSTFKIISSPEKTVSNGLTQLEEKAKWIFKHFFKKSDLATSLERFRRKVGINWWDLDENNYDKISDFLYYSLKKKIYEHFKNQ